MTTTITVEAQHSDVHITFLDMGRVPSNDIAAVEADPENGIEAQEARTAYGVQPSVQTLKFGDVGVYHAHAGRTIVISEVPPSE